MGGISRILVKVCLGGRNWLPKGPFLPGQSFKDEKFTRPRPCSGCCLRRAPGNPGKMRDKHRRVNPQNLPRLWPFSYLG
jgi:hypothetical protein